MRFFVDHDHKIVLGWSAKCGCTHIKKIWFYLQGKPNHPVHGDFHEKNVNTIPKDYIWFIVCRNPYERLLSGFLDKYKKNGEFRTRWGARYGPVTFNTCVNEISKLNWSLFEPHHFKPQLDEYFFDELVSYPTVKVYDLNTIDYTVLEAAFNKSIPQELLNFKGNHTNTRKKIDFNSNKQHMTSIDDFTDVCPLVSNFYTKELYDKVTQVYNKDLTFFKKYGYNYSIDIENNV